MGGYASIPLHHLLAGGHAGWECLFLFDFLLPLSIADIFFLTLLPHSIRKVSFPRLCLVVFLPDMGKWEDSR